MDLPPAGHHLDVDRAWQAFLRRFDLEHTFWFFKQVLGWTTPKICNPDAADRWAWLVLVAYTQLRLARNLTGDLRRPWERPTPPGSSNQHWAARRDISKTAKRDRTLQAHC